MKAFLGRDYPNFFTVDLICHGVPSPGLFAAYLQWLERRHHAGIESFTFRDKSRGWGEHGTAALKDGRIIDLPCEGSSYYSLFFSGNLQRESCYACPFARGERCSDMTIGDYWGIEHAHPELLEENGGPLQRHRGISAILVNLSLIHI